MSDAIEDFEKELERIKRMTYRDFGRLFYDLEDWGLVPYQWPRGWPRRVYLPGVGMPPLKIKESDGNLIIEARMPGVNKEDINIELREDSLSLYAENKEEKKEEKGEYHRLEWTQRSYRRETTLPVKIDPEKAKARYTDGILRIEAPIAEKKKEMLTKIAVE